MSALFGVAGNPENFQIVSRASADAPAWLKSIGLDAYEYQCGKGVHVGEKTARLVGRRAGESDIRLSLHAPYFISLANPDPARREQTIGYILAACQVADWMGAGRVIIHAGSLMGRGRREALEIAKETLSQAIAACDAAGYGYLSLCPETMGKIHQLGDLEEVLELCSLDARLIPCVDFGHLYARWLGNLPEPDVLLDTIAARLGESRASHFHSHFSKIEFTLRGGEYRHLRFQDPGWGPEYPPLMAAIARRGWSPVIICESAGTQDADALAMKAEYLSAMERINTKETNEI